MFLRTNTSSPSWPDRTMTALQRQRYRACEKELTGLPQLPIFDASLTDAEAETYFLSSYRYQEEGFHTLHNLKELRVHILQQLQVEMSLLSPGEHDLMVRAVMMGGNVPLFNPEFLFFARSLVYRLWGSVTQHRQYRTLTIPVQVSFPALLSLASDEHRAIREKLDPVFDMVESTLYLMGILSIEPVIQDMDGLLSGTFAAGHPNLCRRALLASFDSVIGMDGKEYLIHPGLADPMTLLDRLHSGAFGPESLQAEELGEAYESLMDVEDPLYDRLLSIITPLMRPEHSAEETIEDILLLIKQGTTMADLREVLSSGLVCQITPEMVEVLEEMIHRIPRWGSLTMGQVQ